MKVTIEHGGNLLEFEYQDEKEGLEMLKQLAITMSFHGFKKTLAEIAKHFKKAGAKVTKRKGK